MSKVREEPRGLKLDALNTAEAAIGRRSSFVDKSVASIQ